MTEDRDGSGAAAHGGRREALVVEGGAMRGIFAAGVLDRFIERDHFAFDGCFGVSAGSTALAAYLSGQRGRTRRIIEDYSCRPEFINPWRFLCGGHLLDLDWLWPITLTELPFDFDAFEARGIPLYIGLTRASDAAPRQLKADRHNLAMAMKASCSLPLAYREFVSLEGEAYTDGGVSDSIPVEAAWRAGFTEITVVLSQRAGYLKSPPRFPALMRWAFRRHPQLGRAMLERHRHYNRTLAFLASPPPGCTVRLIQPPPQFPVGRLTKDSALLGLGYQMGAAAADGYLAGLG
ncbi:patatin family protein [Ferrimonas sediminicola]|uniref:Patatin family protein n=1 Tax=Ferrimonas sediminicola TaxID=2569538 RepID=A0A4U1BGB2_9GAMM|nr:patatin family protein [Ferrimonas sediminicola]TKB50368.1 patatin family protein [Ferrimonas sediminicola]